MAVHPLGITTGAGQGLDPLQSLFQAHIHIMGHPFQPENGGVLPLLV